MPRPRRKTRTPRPRRRRRRSKASSLIPPVYRVSCGSMISFVLLVTTIVGPTALTAVHSFVAGLFWLWLSLAQQRMEALRDGGTNRFPCRYGVPARGDLRQSTIRTSGVLRTCAGPSASINGTRDAAVMSHSWKVLVENVACCPSNKCVGGRAWVSLRWDTGAVLTLTGVLPYSALKAPRVVGTRGALPRR